MAEEDTNQTEGTATEGGEGQQAPAPKKKKMLLLISVAVALVGICVAVGVVFFMGGESHDEDVADSNKVAAPVVKDIPEFNVSLLTDDPGSQHFVKLKAAVELVKLTDVAAVDEAMPKLQDDWGGFLRQMRLADLQGSANLQRLKEGLLRRANQSLAPVEVKAVYIRELLIQ